MSEKFKDHMIHHYFGFKKHFSPERLYFEVGYSVNVLKGQFKEVQGSLIIQKWQQLSNALEHYIKYFYLVNFSLWKAKHSKKFIAYNLTAYFFRFASTWYVETYVFKIK